MSFRIHDPYNSDGGDMNVATIRTAKTFRIHVPCNPPKTTAQQQKTAVRNGYVTKYDPPAVKQAKEYLTKLFMPYSPRRSKIFKGASRLFFYKLIFLSYKRLTTDC